MRWSLAWLVAATLCFSALTEDAAAACPCDACASSSDCNVACDAVPCDSMGCACDAGCDPCRCDRDRLLSSCSLLKGNPCSCRYVTLQGGWNGLHDYNGEQDIPLPPPPAVVRRGTFSDGWGLGGAIGRRISPSSRAEFEFSFRSNTADEWYVNGIPAGQWSGHFYSYAFMTNLYHDFESCSAMGWTPYIGGGIGLALLDGDFRTATLDLEIDDEEFAYQLMIGGSRQIRPGVETLVEYRYFATTDFQLTNNTPATPVPFGDDAYEADGIFFGLRLYR